MIMKVSLKVHLFLAMPLWGLCLYSCYLYYSLLGSYFLDTLVPLKFVYVVCMNLSFVDVVVNEEFAPLGLSSPFEAGLWLAPPYFYW